jgi:hypothetical protein
MRLSKRGSSNIRLLFAREVSFVAIRQIYANCDLFDDNPGQARSQYRVQSDVSPDVFGLFLDALAGKDTQITSDSTSGLSRLSVEFGFG